MPDWVKDKQQRLQRIRAAKAALEAEEAEAGCDPDDGCGDAGGGSASSPKPGEPPSSEGPPDRKQRNFSDPDSRIMKTSEGFQQAYNAQAAVDASSQVIVAVHVTNAGNDRQQLLPMLDAIQINTGSNPRELSADSGYCSGRNLAELEERNIRAYVATGRQKHGSSSATGSRTGPPGSSLQRMVQRLKRGGHRSRYRLRKQSVESVFGQIKAVRGFRQFLRRGRDAVRYEWTMVCTAHNLLKLARATLQNA